MTLARFQRLILLAMRAPWQSDGALESFLFRLVATARLELSDSEFWQLITFLRRECRDVVEPVQRELFPWPLG